MHSLSGGVLGSGVGLFLSSVGTQKSFSPGVLLTPDWPSSTWRAVVENHVKRGTVKIVDQYRPRLIVPNYFNYELLSFMADQLIITDFKFAVSSDG